MRARLGDIRLTIKEALETIGTGGNPTRLKMAFEALLSLQQQLDERLMSRGISKADYDAEWSDTLRAAGWTRIEYERELDRRWDYIDVLRGVAPKTAGPN
jgi:hypothetical protein